MNISLDAFCDLIKELNKSNAEKAMAILWYYDHEQPGISKTAGQLTKVMTDHHLGTPNQTALAETIRKTKFAGELKNGFSLRPGSRSIIRKWLPEDLEGVQPLMDHSLGYLPDHIWISTRGYIEKICRELNGCFRNAYYNAAAVMLRRLLETLLIEAYEHLGRHTEIVDGGGNYLMLRERAERACGENGHEGLKLGRDSKTALKNARDVGNWSAHARRFLAHASDLLKFQDGLRLLAQELILIAELARKKG